MFNISFVFEILWFLKVESFSLSWPIGALQTLLIFQHRLCPHMAWGSWGCLGLLLGASLSTQVCSTNSLTYGQHYWGLLQIANFMNYIQWLLCIISYISWVNIQQILTGYTPTSIYYFKYKKKMRVESHVNHIIPVYNLVGTGEQDELGSLSGIKWLLNVHLHLDWK